MGYGHFFLGDVYDIFTSIITYSLNETLLNFHSKYATYWYTVFLYKLFTVIENFSDSIQRKKYLKKRLVVFLATDL